MYTCAASGTTYPHTDGSSDERALAPAAQVHHLFIVLFLNFASRRNVQIVGSKAAGTSVRLKVEGCAIERKRATGVVGSTVHRSHKISLRHQRGRCGPKLGGAAAGSNPEIEQRA